MRRFLWIIPPSLGFAAYLTGPGGLPGPAAGRTVVEASTSQSGKANELREMPYHDMADLTNAMDAACLKEQEALLSLGPEELKSLILRLQKTIDQVGVEGGIVSLGRGRYLDLAVAQLVRMQKGEAVAWVRENGLDGMGEAVKIWAQVDPDAAYAAIVREPGAYPCSPLTAMAMLQAFGERDHALLRERAPRMPWERMNAGEPFGPSATMTLPGEDSSVRPWMESGAAAELSKLGLDTRDLLNRWARESPDEALAQWLSGQEMPAISHDQALSDMLYLRADERHDEPRIQEALDRLSPADRDRVAVVLTAFATKCDTVPLWKLRYPDLIRTQSGTP